jgi:hypothetical protein
MQHNFSFFINIFCLGINLGKLPKYLCLLWVDLQELDGEVGLVWSFWVAGVLMMINFEVEMIWSYIMLMKNQTKFKKCALGTLKVGLSYLIILIFSTLLSMWNKSLNGALTQGKCFFLYVIELLPDFKNIINLRWDLSDILNPWDDFEIKKWTYFMQFTSISIRLNFKL